jgi:hypothetical protein
VVAQERMAQSEAALFTPAPKRSDFVVDLTTTDAEEDDEQTDQTEQTEEEEEDSSKLSRRRTRHSAPEPKRRRRVPLTAAEAIEQFHAFLMSL